MRRRESRVCAFLGYHAIVLAAIGIRFDLPAEKVAFLPWGREWSVLRRRKGSGADDGKYSPAEKGDYLAILSWSLLTAASGILLRWPSFFGVPGASAYDWIRTMHAGFGAALTVHLLAVHLPQRWWYAAVDFRRAILRGTVPLREAEKRSGWVRDLVARGILVPTPETEESAEDRESAEVRELLERGNRFAREGKYGEACDSYKEALRLLPDYSQARFNLAVALAAERSKGGSKGAVDDLHREGPVQSDGREGEGDARRNRKGNDVKRRSDLLFPVIAFLVAILFYASLQGGRLRRTGPDPRGRPPFTEGRGRFPRKRMPPAPGRSAMRRRPHRKPIPASAFLNMHESFVSLPRVPWTGAGTSMGSGKRREGAFAACLLSGSGCGQGGRRHDANGPPASCRRCHSAEGRRSITAAGLKGLLEGFEEPIVLRMIEGGGRKWLPDDMQ